MDKEKFKRICDRIESTRDKNGNFIKVNDILIEQDDKIYSHNFTNNDNPSDIRSISKTVMTLAAYLIMDMFESDEHIDFDEDTYIYPIISPVINIRNKATLEKFKKIKVKHLLTHRIGYDKVLLMRGDIAHLDPYTYLDYLVNQPIKYNPGEYYLYSNAGFYLLSVVLEELIKEDLLTFINKNLFTKININRLPYWEKYGNYLAGATRLWLYPEELLNIGKLIMNKGKFAHMQIISEERINRMLEVTTYTPEVDITQHIFRRHAYANGIWLAKDSIFFGHGTDGQTLVMIPDKNAIIVTLSEQEDIFPLERIISDIITDLL